MDRVRVFPKAEQREYVFTLPRTTGLTSATIADMFDVDYVLHTQNGPVFPSVQFATNPTIPKTAFNTPISVPVQARFNFQTNPGLDTAALQKGMQSFASNFARELTFPKSGKHPFLIEIKVDTVHLQGNDCTVDFIITPKVGSTLSYSSTPIGAGNLPHVLHGCIREGLIRALRPVIVKKDKFLYMSQFGWQLLSIESNARINKGWNSVSTFLALINWCNSRGSPFFSLSDCTDEIFPQAASQSSYNSLFKARTQSVTKRKILSAFCTHLEEADLLLKGKSGTIPGYFVTPLGQALAQAILDHQHSLATMTDDDAIVVSKW
jgi:hypothetical protein